MIGPSAPRRTGAAGLPVWRFALCALVSSCAFYSAVASRPALVYLRAGARVLLTAQVALGLALVCPPVGGAL